MSAGTTKRGIRIPDVLWAEYQAACEVAGVNASEQIRQLIQDWLDNNEGRSDAQISAPFRCP